MVVLAFHTLWSLPQGFDLNTEPLMAMPGNSEMGNSVEIQGEYIPWFPVQIRIKIPAQDVLDTCSIEDHPDC